MTCYSAVSYLLPVFLSFQCSYLNLFFFSLCFALCPAVLNFQRYALVWSIFIHSVGPSVEHLCWNLMYFSSGKNAVIMYLMTSSYFFFSLLGSFCYKECSSNSLIFHAYSTYFVLFLCFLGDSCGFIFDPSNDTRPQFLLSCF